MLTLFSRAKARRQVERDSGDAARELGDWERAERHYKAQLKANPSDVQIWVQLGHAIREQGRFAEAATAYAEAVNSKAPASLSEEERGDAFLHLAHSWKLAGKPDKAIKAFQHCLGLMGRKDVFDDLAELGGSSEGFLKPVAHKPAVLLVLNDLISYLTDHTTLSGIQRVQIGILQGLFEDGDVGYRFLWCSSNTPERDAVFWLINDDAIRDLVAYVVSGKQLRRSDLDLLMSRIHRSGIAIHPGKDDVVFFPGAFWCMPRVGVIFNTLKESGARVGVYIHDVIPLSHPEYCVIGLVEEFATSFAEMVRFTDFFFTVSDYSGSVLRQWLNTIGLKEVPISTLPLAHSLTVEVSQNPRPSFVNGFRSRLQGQPYALYVSTVEGRKNHIYVAQAWKELLREGADMPDLVFLGRPGWRSEGLMGFLEGTRFLDGRVHLLHDVSDGDLAYLYENCVFTVFPSFVEGWGLPVGESLMYGRPCVASNTSSVPEVGGDFVDYIDPFDLRGGLDVIRKLATDIEYREMRAENIQANFQPRNWHEVTQRLRNSIAKIKRLPVNNDKTGHRLGEGEVCKFGAQRFADDGIAGLMGFPARVLMAQSFYEREGFGAWMRGKSGNIKLPTVLAEGTPVTVYLFLDAPPWAHKIPYVIEISDLRGSDGDKAVQSNTKNESIFSSVKSIEPSAMIVSKVSGKVGPYGIVRIGIMTYPEQPHFEVNGCEFYIGVRSLMYHGEAQVSLPISPIESFIKVHHFDQNPCN